MENLYSYLEAACKSGDEDAVCRFLKEVAAVGSTEESHGDIINHRDKKGLTPLGHAVRNNHHGIVKLLLEHTSVDVNATCSGNRSVLTLVSNDGDGARMARMLCEAGCDVNQSCGGPTLGTRSNAFLSLLLKFAYLHADLFHCLIDSCRGFLNEPGTTSLMYALQGLRRGKYTEEMVCKVIDKIADINKTIQEDTYWLQENVILFILKSPYSCYAMTPVIVEKFIQAGADIRATDGDGDSVLLLALRGNLQPSACHALIRAGADVGPGELHAVIMATVNRTGNTIGSGNLGAVDAEKMIVAGKAMPTSLDVRNDLDMPRPGHEGGSVFVNSPLSMCFFVKNLPLVNFCISRRFLNMYDLEPPSDFKRVLYAHLVGDPELSSAARLFYDQPKSLLTLSFVQVSLRVGFCPERRKRKLSTTGLPPLLQRKLLFQ